VLLLLLLLILCLLLWQVLLLLLLLRMMMILCLLLWQVLLLLLLLLSAIFITHRGTAPTPPDARMYSTHPVAEHDAGARGRLERPLVEIRVLHIPTTHQDETMTCWGRELGRKGCAVSRKGRAHSWRRLAVAGVMESQLKKMRRSAKWASVRESRCFRERVGAIA
jgi:hypothetical protein